MTLKHGSLFSGVGMIDWGLEVSPEIKTVFQVEIAPYPKAILKKHWPDVRQYEDIKQCKGEELGHVDILSGGFPCTSISGAGRKKLGIGTPEQPTSTSGLWYHFLRLIREIRPPWVIVENVARLLHTSDGDRVLSDLEKEGYAWGTTILESEVFGIPHSRPRVWIIACNNYPFSHRNSFEEVKLVFQKDLPDNFWGEIKEKSQYWDYWKRQLGTGNAGQSNTPEESEFNAYRRSLRTVHGYTKWVDRVKCCGNSVVWLIPALLGAFIVQVEEERASR